MVEPPKKKKRSVIHRGKKVEDEAERQRKGRLGARGEQVAFAWAVSPLVDLYDAQDFQGFRQAVNMLRARLSSWDLSADLRTQFDGAVEQLTSHDLSDDDLLDSLQQLSHISGELASDAFGFDLLAWLPPQSDRPAEVLLVEVKTSLARADRFHLSRTQHDLAAEVGPGYAVLRVVLPRGRSARPELVLLVDPVGLYRQDPPTLDLWPEQYGAKERSGRPAASTK